MATRSFLFRQKPGHLPASQPLTASVENNVKVISVSFASTATWLMVAPTTGLTPQTVQISLTNAVKGLAVGTYSATIVVSAPEAVNSPQTCLVNLEVRKK